MLNFASNECELVECRFSGQEMRRESECAGERRTASNLARSIRFFGVSLSES